tara:strand:- start:35 stop:601 length:567 start_codon:yes stop_codon:yes gene_type:complete
MSNIKSVYIKAPKKTISNKNMKMVIKKNSLKKIENKLLKENFTKVETIDKKDINNNPKDFNKKKPTIKNNINLINSNTDNTKKNHQMKIYKKKFTKNSNIKRLNIKKNKSKKKERYVRLLIDSNKDVKGRMETKKKFQTILNKLSKKKLKKVLVNKGLIKKNSKAPTKLLTDIYLNSKLLGDINVIQQ